MARIYRGVFFISALLILWFLCGSARAEPAPAESPVLELAAAAGAGPQRYAFDEGRLRVDARGFRVSYERGAERWAFSVKGPTLTTHEPTDDDAAELPRAGGASAAQGAALRGGARGELWIAALPDGTIRWYRGAAAGPRVELLALFVHPQQRRWIAWTPGGYYSASVRGEDLLQWRVPRGGGVAPDVFPVGLLAEHRLRPDVLRRALVTQDEAQAVAQADAEAERAAPSPPLQRLWPPVVTVLSPAEGHSFTEGELTLRVALRSPSGEAVTLEPRVLGAGLRAMTLERPTAGPRAAAADEEVRTFTVVLPQRDVTIEVAARTALTRAAPRQLRLRYAGALPLRRPPRLYALVIGVTEYANLALRLRFPAKDARDMAAVLERQRGGLYQAAEVHTLTDGEATRARIVKELAWLIERAGEDERAVLFVAGHGMNDERGRYHFLPHDGDPLDMKKNLSADELQEALQGLRGRGLVLLDTCRAGAAMSGQRGDGDTGGLVNRLGLAGVSLGVIAASTGGQAAREDPAWQNGAFTRAALEGLQGRADYEYKGRISLTLLGNYISQRVPELTHGTQTPTLVIPSAVEDFQLASVRVRKPLLRTWWFLTTTGVALAAAAAGTAVGIYGARTRVPTIDVVQ